MSAHVLLNLLNELGKKILSVFPIECNKFINTGAQIQDFVYHMTLISHFISHFAPKHHDFVIRKCNVFMDIIA